MTLFDGLLVVYYIVLATSGFVVGSQFGTAGGIIGGILTIILGHSFRRLVFLYTPQFWEWAFRNPMCEEGVHRLKRVNRRELEIEVPKERGRLLTCLCGKVFLKKRVGLFRHRVFHVRSDGELVPYMRKNGFFEEWTEDTEEGH